MNLGTYIKICLIAIGLSPYTSYAQNTVCPPNLDFEQGNLSNWEFYTGSCCPTNTNNNTGPVAGRHTLMSGTGVDPIGGFPVVAPGGGNYSLKLGNSNPGAEAERARYYVRVPPNQNNIYTLLYSYAVVFQNPGHGQTDQPRFEVTVFDSATGVPAPCNEFTHVSGIGLPGFQTAPGGVLYKPWSTASIDLSSMAGRTVAIDFTSGDCALGGHYGYAYVDVACNFFQSHTLYCPDNPTYTLSAPPGFETYEWRDSSLQNVLGNTQDLTITTPTVTTAFAVILEPYPGFGCPDTIFTTFFVTDMDIKHTPDTALCSGTSVQLGSGTNSTSSPYVYSWTPSTSLSCNNCDSPVASPVVTTKYYITITDKDGCDATDSVMVRVDERVYADIIVADTFCAFDSVLIINGVANPPKTEFLWNLHEDKGAIISGIGTDTIIGTWQSRGLKFFRVSAINGMCNAHDSDYVYIEERPLAEFEAQRDVCLNAPWEMRPYLQNASYHWTIDGHIITDTVFKDLYKLSWPSAGKKLVRLKVINEAGCIGTKEEYVGVHEYPIADIIPVKADNLCKGKEYKLEAAAGYRYEYSWSPPQYFANNQSASVTGIAEEEGYVYLDVRNQWHCVSRDSFFIDGGLCCDIFMPDAFTPNNDGQNDRYWSPDIDRVQLVRLMIANRRGQVVHDTKAPVAWDGSFNGRPAGQDTYNYYIRYICNGEEMEKKGTLILLR